jgi:hypothetical protein
MVGPAVATTRAEEDVDGGPPTVLSAGPPVATTMAKEDVDGGPLTGAAGGSNSGHHRS